MRQTFGKLEKLKKQKDIQDLFRKGKNLSAYPLALRYLQDSQDDEFNRAAFTVSKKKFNRAVKRNLLKRRMREAYRLNKHQLKLKSGSFLFIYMASVELEFADLEKAMLQIIKQLNNQSL